MRFSNVIGFGSTVETAPGVWEDVIEERKYRGDVLRNTRRYSDGQSVNDDLSVSNSISIVADPYVLDHISAIRYVKWGRALWKISSVEIQSPRLTLQLGGVYNGPTPPTAPGNP